MAILQRWHYYCFISLNFLVSSFVCQVDDSISQTMMFDPDTHQVKGELRCPDSRLLDIVSIQYNYYSSKCSLTCPSLPDSDRLDGINTICLNENDIRQSCYAKNNCTLGDNGTLITRPDDLCVGANKANALVVVYRCINPEYVFDLCGQRALSVNRDRRLIFTTPATSAAAESSRCRCKLSSRSTFSSNLTFTLLRMAQFKDGARLSYQIRSSSILASTPYMTNHLLPENVTDIDAYQTERLSISISLQFSSDSTNNSTAFVVMNSGKSQESTGKDLTVRCNDAPLPTANPETTTRRATTSGSKQAGAITPEDSEIISPNMKVASSSASTASITGPGTNTKPPLVTGRVSDGNVIGLSVALVLVLILVIAGILIYCFLKRRRKQRANKYAERLNANNNTESLLLHPTQVGGIREPTYHELEETDNQYSVIPGEGEYSEYTLANQPEDAAADPYKVTTLDGGTANNPYFDRLKLTANEYATPADESRNSRGSIDVYTENSTTTDDIYAEPCDGPTTDGANGKAQAVVEYDTPADVYAEIRKPNRTPGGDEVELVDSEIYGS